MKLRSWSLSSYLPAIVVLALIAGASPALAEGAQFGTYRVTVQNLTEGQPFSPPVAGTHDRSVRLFQIGGLASAQLESIAEEGMPEPVLAHLQGAAAVSQAVNVGKPVALGGDELIVMGMKATDTATFEIERHRG